MPKAFELGARNLKFLLQFNKAEMAMNEDYAGLWRASAYEAVPYTDDFPEALLVLPELLDGSIGQGKATQVDLQIQLNDKESELVVRDNGLGIQNERRLLQWAAAQATDNLHRNGNGVKKSLSKWDHEYVTADWQISYRKKNKNLQVIKAPFKGMNTDVSEVEEDEKTLMPSGTEFRIKFNQTILGTCVTAKKLLQDIKEIIQTRYSQEILDQTCFNVDVLQGNKHNILNSHAGKKWKSFKTSVIESIEGGTTVLAHSGRFELDGGYYTLDIFHIEVSGNQMFGLKKEFPLYGQKGTRSSRAHMSLNGRMIEAVPIYKLMDRSTNHNDLNGWIVFVDFVPNRKDNKEDLEKLPIPCTTKVSFYENNPVFRRVCGDIGKIMNALVYPPDAPVPTPKPRARTPEPVPPPPPAPAPEPKAPQEDPKDYNTFMKVYRPIVTKEHPTFTTQEITTEIARRWQVVKAKREEEARALKAQQAALQQKPVVQNQVIPVIVKPKLEQQDISSAMQAAAATQDTPRPQEPSLSVSFDFKDSALSILVSNNNNQQIFETLQRKLKTLGPDKVLARLLSMS